MSKLFSTIANNMNEYTTIILTICKKGNRVTLTFYPKIDKKLTDKKDISKKLVPLVITGKPEELDEQFLNAFLPGLEQINGLISNLEIFSKNISKEKEQLNKSDAAKSTDKSKKDKDDEEDKQDTTNLPDDVDLEEDNDEQAEEDLNSHGVVVEPAEDVVPVPVASKQSLATPGATQQQPTIVLPAEEW